DHSAVAKHLAHHSTRRRDARLVDGWRNISDLVVGRRGIGAYRRMDDFPKRRGPRANDSGRLAETFQTVHTMDRHTAGDLAEDADGQVKGADRLVIALPCAFIDQRERSGTFGLGAKEKPAHASSTGTLLI